MRLHHLAITGFGPFAGSEQVDLDLLGTCGLFLIHGPTGAGKTSILDAICFALYAAVPGARSGGRAGLRSDHAAEGVVPEVTLEFTAGGRRLRVCRSPEFSRAKKRGTGVTTVPAKVLLEQRMGSGWVARGTRHDEVALMLGDILGMGLEQFIKVVLLPQGDFSAFLRASPEERRSLLEKLFDTSRFTDVETWLAERRRLATAAVGSARDKVATSLLRVDDVVTRLDPGDDIAGHAWSDVPHPEIGAVLAELLAVVELRASAALTAVDHARAAVAQTEAAVHHGAAVLRHQQTGAVARGRLSALDEQSATYEDASRAVALAERADAVSGFVAAVETADQRCQDASVKVAGLRSPLEFVRHDVDASEVALLIERVAVHTDTLQRVVAQASRAETLAAQSAGHGQLAALEDQAAAAFTEQRSKAETLRRTAELSLEACRVASAEIPGLEARVATLSRVQRLLDDQVRSARDLEILQAQFDAANRVSLDARERLVDLRERRLAGLAAELASGLEPGSACPVCGSCAHPVPATTSDVVSANDISDAEAGATCAAEALGIVRSTISAEMAGSQTRALELSAEQDQVLATEVSANLASVTAEIAQARAAAAGLPEARSAIAALSQEVERLRVLAERAVTARTSARALADSSIVQSRSAEDDVKMLLAGHDQSCPCHTEGREHAGVGELVLHHGQSLARLRSLAGGLNELVTHEASAKEAKLRLSAVLKDRGFDSMEQAKEALLPAAKVTELTTLLRAAEQQRAQATALLAQPDVVASLELPTPDVDALARAHAQTAASLADAGRRHALSEQAQRDLRELSGTVAQALSELGPAEEVARLVQELADCAAGNSADNALRMRLSSYVLAARLDEIATLANERLVTMTDGRYTLEYTDARAAKGARSGLGLVVRDAWTGQPRETSSLSGGEAFMASLALALGLGDAVRAEAGGFDLQTLFVDEGFGSLDEDSLEQVMAVLDTLREGGRAVGIVSHVTELRARIPQQLQVIKAQAGSRISISSGAASVT